MSYSTTIRMMRVLELVIIFGIFMNTHAVEINCSQPPQLVEPQNCCTDGGRDEVADKCAAKFGMTGQSQMLPSPDTATCLAECVLTESKYLEGQNLNIPAIRSDLQRKFPSDPEHVAILTQAYEKCAPIALRKVQQLQQSPQGLRTKCSPLSGIILGCTYTQYFQNCPAGHWKQSEQCQIAKDFLKKCAVF